MIAKLKENKGELLLAAAFLVLVGVVVWLSFQLYILSPSTEACSQSRGLGYVSSSAFRDGKQVYEIEFLDADEAISINAVTNNGIPQEYWFGSTKRFVVNEQDTVVTVVVKTPNRCRDGVQSTTYVFVPREESTPWRLAFMIWDDASNQMPPMIVR